MKNIKKDITFFYTDTVEKQTLLPIAKEAEKRGYETRFTSDIFKKAEIGFYCQHVNFAKNSMFSCVHLHDLGQQHGQWPVMWKNEFWNQFDIGFLPNKEWADMWHAASCYDFVRPRRGCYFVGWAKSDFIFKDDTDGNATRIIGDYHIDASKKNILYAPSWEWGNRQLEMVEAVKGLDVNLLIKQAPWNPDLYPEQHRIIRAMYEKCVGLQNVFLIDTSVNIFDVIKVSDILVSEESSTLYEAMMLEKPVIAVTDWLVPDSNPPRLPEFPYDFAIHIKKSELRDTLLKVISDSAYREKISAYRKENFPYVGNAAQTVMDVLDTVLYGANNEVPRIDELPLVKTPVAFRKSVSRRKRFMRLLFIKRRFVDRIFLLRAVWDWLRVIKNRLKNSGGVQQYSIFQSSLSLSAITTRGGMMKELRDVWNAELLILKEVDSLCKKHGIRYFADSGTLLGAVRHSGFIPWDDDIDLAMFRRDYDRFRKIAESELPDGFFCQSGYNDKGFYGGMLHIRMNGTAAIQMRNFPNTKYHQGIFIDVFPLDGVIQNRFFSMAQNFCRRVINVIMCRKNCVVASRSLWKRFILFFPALLPQKLLFSLFEFVCKWKKAESSEYVDTVSYFGTSGTGIRKASLYEMPVYLPFENTQIPAPAGYDEVLRATYGENYMIPIKAASDHGEMFFDTEHSYKDYLNGTRHIPKEFFAQCQPQ